MKRNILRYLGYAALAAVVLVVLISLDAYREVKKIGSGSIWSVPSRVYSSPAYFRAGDDIEKTGLEDRLAHLNYRLTEDAREPGEYAREKDGMTLFLRSFDYPEGSSAQQRVNLEISGGSLRSIVDPASGRKLPSFTLEPECIGIIFDQSREDRRVVDLDECPSYLLDAIIATEDRRFYEHGGIDPRAILRAAFVNLRHGRIVEGGSTITQQLIKNIFFSNKRSFVRKTKEVWMALIMDSVYPKDKILEMYVNEVYMGQCGHSGIFGVGRAASLFFDKDVHDLELSQAALLCGIIRAPNLYSPYSNPGACLARRNTVLELMLDEGYIDAEEYSDALARPLGVVPVNGGKRQAPYFVDHLLKSVSGKYPLELLSKGGYRIFTTLDMHCQRISEEKLGHVAQNLGKRCKDLEGAVVVLDPSTGKIRAMVGGLDYSKSQYNRATMIRRHIGSLVKPVVYYTALRRGCTLGDFVDDSAISVELEDSTIWKPENYDHVSHENVMLIEALANSYNLATVRLGMEVGVKNVAGELSQLMPDVNVETNPSLLLGAVPCSPIDVAGAYCSFANGGVGVYPSGLESIVNENNTVLEESRPVPGRHILDTSVVYLLDYALEEVVRSGTAKKSVRYGMPDGVCAKTGTTNDLRDSWFCAFTGDMVVSVWMGTDDFSPVGLTGSMGAMPVASMIFAAAGSGGMPEKPDDVVYVNVDGENGKLAPRWSRGKRRIPYIRGTEPTEVSEKDMPGIFKLFRSIL